MMNLNNIRGGEIKNEIKYDEEGKSQMTSNQKKKKADMNCGITTMKNMILYFIMIILKQTKKIKSKEYNGRTRNKPETLYPTWRGKLYAQKSTQKKTVQFYDNRQRFNREICHNTMAQYIVRNDIIEYEK